ncbi:MAG: DNA alkylation repair protein [Gammaproteobacteria bacterium]|nr:DNA alkylation repair protein [Gammaproteobacteria bacterium]
MSGTSTTTLNEIKQQLHTLADTGIAASSQRYFKTAKGQYAEGDIFLGIRVPVLRELAKRYKSLPLQHIQSLLASEYHEQRLLALIMLVNCYKKSSSNTRNEIFNFYLNSTHYVNNWDLVDTSAVTIVGDHLSSADRAVLYQLARSENIWQRRIAVIATFYFIRADDFTDCLEICRLLLNDPEDLIHKACGWMLREIGKRNTAVEEDFLDQHASDMPRTMLRYAIEKLPTTKRKAYMAIKHR